MTIEIFTNILYIYIYIYIMEWSSTVALSFSGGSESTCNAEDTGLIPGSGKSPGDENGNPLQL